jgi:ribosomal protein S18 acetylase RimI-like enzyme
MVIAERDVVLLEILATIRPAVAEDLPKLEWFGEYAHFRKLYARIYRDYMAGRQFMLVAEVNDFPVGQVFINLESGLGLMADEPHGYLYALRVMKPFRRQGLGTALVRAAERHLRDSNYRRVTIAVAKDNDAAMRLYRRLGYEPISEDAGRWQYEDHLGKIRHVSEPCWIMERYLSR